MLDITAQTELFIEADGQKVNASVFVEPSSEQSCLLGMNVLPHLGVNILKANGEPLHHLPVGSGSDSTSTIVRLVQANTIPGRKGRFVDATISKSLEYGSEVLF